MKGKLTKQRDDKTGKVTKPEELVRLYDLLLQVNSLSICMHSCYAFIHEKMLG